MGISEKIQKNKYFKDKKKRNYKGISFETTLSKKFRNDIQSAQ